MVRRHICENFLRSDKKMIQICFHHPHCPSSPVVPNRRGASVLSNPDRHLMIRVYEDLFNAQFKRRWKFLDAWGGGNGIPSSVCSVKPQTTGSLRCWLPSWICEDIPGAPQREDESRYSQRMAGKKCGREGGGPLPQNPSRPEAQVNTLEQTGFFSSPDDYAPSPSHRSTVSGGVLRTVLGLQRLSAKLTPREIKIKPLREFTRNAGGSESWS